jgi:signal transduction histidine kinase
MLQIDQFNIVEQITVILDLLRNTIDQRKIVVKQVTGKLSDEQLTIYSDAARFRQIFYQIISNAIRFTQNGSITITIETEA